MLILANENIPRALIEALRSSQHDVFWARTDARGAADEDLLARAVLEGRVLLTFDRDFGELAFRASLPANCGVILLRFPKLPPDALASAVEPVVSGRTDWPGHFSVVEPARIRMSPLPGSAG